MAGMPSRDSGSARAASARASTAQQHPDQHGREGELADAERDPEIGGAEEQRDERSSGERAAREYVQDRGGLIFTARQLRGLDGAGLQPVIAQILHRIGNRPCYLTLDIDCLDPAFAPGTGTPEPGGYEWLPTLDLLRAVCRRKRVVGFDVVELAPIPGLRSPDFLAAKLVYAIFSLALMGRKRRLAGRQS